jgi:hypothetical protein
MKYVLVMVAMLWGMAIGNCAVAGPKATYTIDTGDMTLFWQAYDSLAYAHGHKDSINIVRKVYLERLSDYGKQFVHLRGYSVMEYVAAIGKYPRYFRQLRKKTINVVALRPAIDSAYSRMAAIIPGYKYPDVCFAVGCFRGGGTGSKNKQAILIGSEIALGDSTMDISEFKGELHALYSHATGNPVTLIAHESVHCVQWNGQNNSLLSVALAEGAADFFTQLALHSNINQDINDYGLQHECELWTRFQKQMNGKDLSYWFYNTATQTTAPADLGYFMGRKICEAYYNSQPDKKTAVMNLLDRSKYLEVMKESGYNGGCGK